MTQHSTTPATPAYPVSAVNIIAGRRVPIAGDALVSRNPARPAQVICAAAPGVAHVADAVAAARQAGRAWAAAPRERRFAVLRRFAELAKTHAPRLAGALADEVGKAMWEAKAEAALLAGKVDITLDEAPEGGLRRVSDTQLALSPTRTGRTTFKPHGVMAVLGPFNFPMHLPNGHIVPALAAGNTVVFKPSEKAMLCGQMLVELFDEALAAEGAPRGVVNLLQGGPEVAAALVTHEHVDAIAFTGSWPVGRKILEMNLDTPGRIAALEMGGSAPTLIMPDADLRLAVVETARSAFATTGQRCTCTRRLVVHEAVAERVVSALDKVASNLIVGEPRSSAPVFMGPIINDAARQGVLAFQASAAKAGARILVESTAVSTQENGAYITPGVMMVDAFRAAAPGAGAAFDPGADVEIFGPLLRVVVVRSLDEAIEQANATRYGLAASIFTRDEAHIARFLHEVRAGCLNVNTGTAGASSKLPFGGLGLSGNHRPAGAYALDYCAYPVASMVETGGAVAISEGMRFEEGWVA